MCRKARIKWHKALLLHITYHLRDYICSVHVFTCASLWEGQHCSFGKTEHQQNISHTWLPVATTIYSFKCYPTFPQSFISHFPYFSKEYTTHPIITSLHELLCCNFTYWHWLTDIKGSLFYRYFLHLIRAYILWNAWSCPGPASG